MCKTAIQIYLLNCQKTLRVPIITKYSWIWLDDSLGGLRYTSKHAQNVLNKSLVSYLILTRTQKPKAFEPRPAFAASPTMWSGLSSQNSALIYFLLKTLTEKVILPISFNKCQTVKHLSGKKRLWEVCSWFLLLWWVRKSDRREEF